MGTPFISLQEPTALDGYLIGKPQEEQPNTIPKTFIDAMEVRTAVFVDEQNVPAENEVDSDDRRSCHWIVYASVNKVVQEEVVDGQGNIVTPRRSSTRSTPIGTVRCVPFPHEAHPVPNGDYWNGELTGTVGPDGTVTPCEPKADSARRTSVVGGIEGGDATVGRPSLPLPTDRATTLHDGKEPYVKLGRLAVVKEFRGHGIAKLLVRTALAWLRSHPTFFNPSVTELGLEAIGVTTEKEIPQWGGLVCVHAQEQVISTWKRLGFEVDEGMGRWKEEGIWHVGMFQRLNIKGEHLSD